MRPVPSVSPYNLFTYQFTQCHNISESAGFPANTLPFIYQDVVAPGTAIIPEDYYDTGKTLRKFTYYNDKFTFI